MPPIMMIAPIPRMNGSSRNRMPTSVIAMPTEVTSGHQLFGGIWISSSWPCPSWAPSDSGMSGHELEVRHRPAPCDEPHDHQHEAEEQAHPDVLRGEILIHSRSPKVYSIAGLIG